MSAGTSVVVIVEIGSQDPAQTRFVQYDRVVQAFLAYRPDQPRGIRVLPRRGRSAKKFLNTQRCGGFSKYLSAITLAITNQKTWSAGPRERLHQVTGRPLRGRMAGKWTGRRRPRRANQQGRFLKRAFPLRFLISSGFHATSAIRPRKLSPCLGRSARRFVPSVLSTQRPP